MVGAIVGVYTALSVMTYLATQYLDGRGVKAVDWLADGHVAFATFWVITVPLYLTLNALKVLVEAIGKAGDKAYDKGIEDAMKLSRTRNLPEARARKAQGQ